MRSPHCLWLLVAFTLSCKGTGSRRATERAEPTAVSAAPDRATPPASSLAAPAPDAAVMASAARGVALSVSSAAEAGSPADGPRIYAKTRFVWVYPEPDAGTQWIGYLRSGSSVRLRSARPRFGPGCGAFYAVEPQGFVCGDGPRATLDPNDAIYRALSPYAAKPDTPWPHSYGESLGLVRYLTPPTVELQRLREGDFRAHTRDVERARAGADVTTLQGVDVSLPERGPPEIPPLPITVFEDRKEFRRRSTVAYSAEARIGERGFLLTGDFTWIPKDRVRPYPHVGFHGLELGGEVRLPLAFFRRDARPKYRRDAAGGLAVDGTTFARLAHVELTGQRVQSGGETYLETKEPGVFVLARDAVVPEPAAKTPWGGALKGEDPGSGAPTGRASWIEVSIEGGWLLAYEGTRPVYVTLISPGKGGTAKAGEDPLERAASPVGRYPISGKFVTSTMEAPNELIHSEVPFAQNIIGPYALHGAYWHDNWGLPQSGGCINLSPIDAKWMFDFTEPKLPEGWHGVRWLPNQGASTLVLLHR